GEGRPEDCGVNVLRHITTRSAGGQNGRTSATYPALQDAQAPLVNVHYRVVFSLPPVDHLVVVDAGYDKCRRVIAAGRQTLRDRRLFVPAALPRQILFGFGDHAEKLDVAVRK